MSDSHLISAVELIDTYGWTRHYVTKLLGEPDSVETFRVGYGRNRKDVTRHYYLRGRVESLQFQMEAARSRVKSTRRTPDQIKGDRAGQYERKYSSGVALCRMRVQRYSA